MSFQNKVALITGGASGIGAQTARDLSKEGCKIAILDLDEGKGEQVSEEINKNGGKAIFIKTNVCKRSEIEAALKQVINEFSDIDFLINSAAILIDGLIHKLEEEAWDQVIETNLKGSFLMIQALSKYWISEAKKDPKNKITDYPDRRIINISSIAANGNIGQIAYASSKSGLIGMTDTCAKELIRYNIRSHVILPTLIDTPMIAELLNKEDQKWRDFYGDRIPFGIGKTSEVSSVIKFLCGKDSIFMNGAALEINGGKLKFL
jgi:3-oxoacyl-[acyl-carrier protein] reductase